MKNTKLLIASFLMLAVLFFVPSCSPDSYSLDGQMDKSDINFEITQDLAADPGGNTVIMKNITPGVILNWDYVTGKSNEVNQTVKYAFKGDYTIKITAVTGGGLVELDPVTITVAEDNLSYVNDPLWTALSGGVGKTKAWVMDNGKYGIGMGALSYGDPSKPIEWGNFTPNWEPEGNPPGSTDADMNWGSYMTFSLDGGPFMKVYNASGVEQQSGAYFLDAGAHTLSTSGVTILRPTNYIPNASNWDANLKVLELTKDRLRIAVFRTNGEGPWWYVWNFVSKEYADSYVPQDVPDPNPPIDLNGSTVGDLVSVSTSTSKTWVLSADSPFDWTDLQGNLLNGWKTAADYEAAGWTGYLASDKSTVIKNKITFDNNGTVKTVNSDGVETSGTYKTSTDGTNMITFEGISPSFKIGSSWATVSTTAQNQWKIIKTAVTGSTVTDMWFGKRDEVKKEYMVFHFVLQNGSVDPIEENKKLIIQTLTNGSSRTFKVSDSWHVDWLAADLTGGWTSATTFGNDFLSNGWVWTAAVKAGLQDPTLTFTKSGSGVTVTKVQNGVTTSAPVIIDAEKNSLEINMNLIAFSDSAAWLPNKGPKWFICKAPLTSILTDGLWLGTVNSEKPEEVIAIHYVIK